MFTDRVVLQLSAGKGGNGVVAWRREKYIPKGGPYGGNGGRGGSVILEADSQVYALDWFRNRRILKAENGQQGGTNLRQGRVGKDLILKVPCGTLIKDVETKEILYDFTKEGQRWVICQGGKGGRGNNSFKTPTNRAPNICTPGRKGEEIKIELELKLIADIGLIGFPNAGKSTLVSTLTQVPLKIGAYPFTTLKPSLGYLHFSTDSKALLADIPGIIKGAHYNKGLGFEFLRHIERTKACLFVLDASGVDGRDPLDDLKVLKEELSKYHEKLLERPFLVVLNKIDQEVSSLYIEEFYKSNLVDKEKVLEISAKDQIGINPLKHALKLLMEKVDQTEQKKEERD